MPGIRKVRDPLHEYVYLSELENRIIAHPLMLRLHYIHQNGTAFLTYPSTHTMRFAHSLGTMHIAGQIITSALRNVRSEVRSHLLLAINDVLDAFGKANGQVLSTARLYADARQIARLTNDGLYRLYGYKELTTEQDLCELLLLQGVRLACLVHDLGHPPYSHTVEGALQQALVKDGERYISHEDVGVRLLKVMLADFSGDTFAPEFANSVFALAANMVEKPRTSPLRGLASIVSGDIDADRADYVRRDMAAAGLSATSYDLGRLLDAATLRVVARDSSPYVELVYTTDALSMLEAFYQARFHLYRWMLWHHAVVRENLTLARATLLLLTTPNPEEKFPPEVASIRREIRDIASMKKGERAYEYFTDFEYLTHLRRIMLLLDATAAQDLSNASAELLLLLKVFLRRETKLMPSLWKRPDEYFEFAYAASSRLNALGGSYNVTMPIQALNKLLSFRYEEHLARLGGRRHLANAEVCREIEQALSTSDHRVYAYYLSGFRATPSDTFELYTRDGLAGIAIARISPSIMRLNEAWEALPHLWLFVVCGRDEKLDLAQKKASTAVALAEHLASTQARG